MNQAPDPARIQQQKQRLLIGVAVFLFLVIVSQAYFRNVSPEAKEAHRFLREMPVTEIQEIVIDPYTVSSLIDHRLVIKDRRKISQLADVLRSASPFSPSHPESRWIAVLRIVTDHGDYGGQVDSTSNGQGSFIWYASQVQGGWNYGAYRQDELGPLLEQFAKASPEPDNQQHTKGNVNQK